ncbi:MAG TPA: stage II sporulation protein M [Gammaproteobacteria bacterium]
MKQDAFEERYGPVWSELEGAIDALSGRGAAARREARAAQPGRKFPALYRRLCHHLALARARRYTLGLQQRLNRLAVDGHRHLYRADVSFLGSVARFIANDFPAAFRRHGRYVAASAALFVLSALGMGIAVQVDGDLVYSVLEPHQVWMMEEMYDPENRALGRERQSDTDVAAFGFYIFHNISIGFQTFAGGLLFGIGTVFFLCLNGLFIGASASHLTSAGFSETFWPFVVGHSSLELTAIVIFGAVGLAIGFAAIAPGQKRRWHAIRDRAVDGLPLIYGGAAMLAEAAFVEAFWSSTTWPPITSKYVVGGLLWLALILYFALCGRES